MSPTVREKPTMRGKGMFDIVVGLELELPWYLRIVHHLSKYFDHGR